MRAAVKPAGGMAAFWPVRIEIEVRPGEIALVQMGVSCAFYRVSPQYTEIIVITTLVIILPDRRRARLKELLAKNRRKRSLGNWVNCETCVNFNPLLRQPSCEMKGGRPPRC